MKPRITQELLDDVIETARRRLDLQYNRAQSKYNNIPNWLMIAMGEQARGVREIPGEFMHPQIRKYWETIPQGLTLKAWKGIAGSNARRAPGDTDEEHWCGAFATWVMLQAGFRRSDLPRIGCNAAEWEKWGVHLPLQYARNGAIFVGWKGKAAHVGFWMGEGTKKNIVLGGNQRDPSKKGTKGIMVSEVDYKNYFDRFSLRWPLAEQHVRTVSSNEVKQYLVQQKARSKSDIPLLVIPS